MSLPSANFSPPASPRTIPTAQVDTAQPPPSPSLELAHTAGPLVEHQHPVLDPTNATPDARQSFYDELNARLYKGEMPTQAMLEEAINAGSVKAVKLLCDTGVDLNLPIDGGGNTRLHVACRLGDIDRVRFLIQCGARLTKENWRRQTPIDLVLHDTELLPETQYAFLREFARKDFGAFVVLIHCRRVDRWDFVALMLAEGLLKANQLSHDDFHDDRIVGELLLNLKVVFKGALKSNDETIIRNCVYTLYHIAQFAGDSTLDQTRQVLTEWSNNADEIVREAYEGCPSKIFF
jgi:hypothetical protein